MAVNSPQQSVDRVNLVYKSTIANVEQEIELPFRLLVVGDFTCNEASEYLDTQDAIQIQDNDLSSLYSRFKPTINLAIENKLTGDGGELALKYEFTSIDDFHPSAIISKTRIFSELQSFISELENIVQNNKTETLKTRDIDQSVLDVLRAEEVSVDDLSKDESKINWLISNITNRITDQLDEILHNDVFMEMEACWRSLDFLVSRVDFSENCEVGILNISKQGLMDDFEDSPEVVQSTFYQLIYSSEFGQLGGKPYGAIIGNYQFSQKAHDVRLLQRIASVASIAHLPFIAAASSEFFGVDSYAGFSKLRDIKSLFEQPMYAKWNSFRESPDSRYIGLTLPAFLLRQPYDVTIGAIVYQESVGKGDKKLLWGNTAFAFASRLMDSFAKYRWCLNITGHDNGQVSGLTVDDTSGNTMRAGKIPTQVLITDKRETEVVAQGFIPLSVHKGDDTAAFYSAYSTHITKDVTSGNKSDNDLSKRLGAQIPYLLIVSRISHYIKMMQREHIGSWTNRREIDQGLSAWLKQYVSDMDNPAPGVRSRRPLRKAVIKVREVEGKGDWFLTNIEITPHIKFMGNSFTLKETSKLEKS